MKILALTVFAAALATAGIGTAAAQRGQRGPENEVRRDNARVVDVDPIQSRGRPGRMYQECWNERDDRYDSGYYRDDRGRLYREKDDGTAGALIGAIIGGVVGNQVGDGRGRTAATVAGAAAGAAIGNNVDRNNGTRNNDNYDRYRDDRGSEVRCRTVQEVNRGRDLFRVTYVYAGQTYETVTRRHPGRTMPVLVNVQPQADIVADYRR
jgi:uncharacterized protein YcfJ